MLAADTASHPIVSDGIDCHVIMHRTFMLHIMHNEGCFIMVQTKMRSQVCNAGSTSPLKAS